MTRTLFERIEEAEFKRIYLTDDQECYVDVGLLPNLSYVLYGKLKVIEPEKEKHVVEVYNKESKEYYTREIFRKYMSYGATPEFNPNTKKSYMFTHQTTDTPEIVQKLLLNNKGYNNLYINWYDSGKNFIDMHSDCTNAWLPGSDVTIVNLNAPNTTKNRMFKIRSKGPEKVTSFDIPLKHGTIIRMNDKAQSRFKHGVDSDLSVKTGRISLTYRKIDITKIRTPESNDVPKARSKQNILDSR